MSALTTSSGSTCPGHQESAWGAVEAIEENDIVESVRKGIAFWRMLQYVLNTSTNVFVSTVLGEKSSDVEQT